MTLLLNLMFFKIELLLISLDFIQDLFRAITTSPLARTIETFSLTAHPDLFTSLVECPNPETTFANLSALDINPPPRIRRCYLSSEGATQVVHAFTESKVESSKLKTLQMDISDLEVPFIELLAIKLPQLQKPRLCLKIFRFTTLTGPSSSVLASTRLS